MRESRTILAAFDDLMAEGTPCALATVVRVTGSSYRRPGARLLAAADGRSWGGVSGGCLERDVLRRLRNLASPPTDSRASSTLVRYDTTDDDADFGSSGVALGCQGLIDIFLEPLGPDAPGPMPYLRRAVVDRQASRVATVVRSTDPTRPVGTRIDAGDFGGATDFVEHDGVALFLERVVPPQPLVLIGGGPDVVPVATLARTLGWDVTVVAPQLTPALLAAADHAVRATDEDPLAGVVIDPASAVVVMTHNYPRDLALLPRLLARPLAYLGLLGPRRRAERLILEAPGVPADALSRVHAPVGLDLGGTTPETIALSIIAEIQAVLAGRPRTSLRDRLGPIYPETHAGADPAPYHPAACPLSA